MGEHADEALFDLLFGRSFFEEDDRRYTVYGDVTCRYCGTKNLKWINEDDKWILVYPEDGARHTCRREPPTGVTITLAGFTPYKDK